MTAVVRDASIENNTLHRELTRRVIQSRHRKTRLLDRAPENANDLSDINKTVRSTRGIELGLEGVGLEKKSFHASGLRMKISSLESNSNNNETGNRMVGMHQWKEENCVLAGLVQISMITQLCTC